MYPIHVLQVSTRPKFTVSLYDESFSSYRPFWEKCTKWPQHDLEHYKLKCSPYVLIVSMSPKVHSVSLYDQPFLKYRAFWDKRTEWPQNDLEPYKFNCTPYIYNYCPQVSNFTPFRSTPSLFNIQAILRQVHWMIPKWPWILQGQMYPIHMLQVSTRPILHSVSRLRWAIFELQAILRKVHQMTPTWPWTLQAQM